ncbi:hypothetical protein [Pedobacter jeongneungensis]|uniref:hypothetical protein n=1 Tax=Pedobacter jeongneungensis TaxID=947309 RepID=UPI000469B25E|nr:hypothetical protein [Pedobacter jeongneungensis]
MTKKKEPLSFASSFDDLDLPVIGHTSPAVRKEEGVFLSEQVVKVDKVEDNYEETKGDKAPQQNLDLGQISEPKIQKEKASDELVSEDDIERIFFKEVKGSKISFGTQYTKDHKAMLDKILLAFDGTSYGFVCNLIENFYKKNEKIINKRIAKKFKI